jgi:hypothetical protein
MLDKRNGRRALAGNPDRIENGSPARGKSAQRLAEAMRRACFGGCAAPTFKEAPNCLPASGLIL